MPFSAETIKILKGMGVVNRAMAIALNIAHAGQFRRDGVTPYHTHPDAVALRVRTVHINLNTWDKAIATAWLHDTGEKDAAVRVTLDDLRSVDFPDDVIVAVDLLTRKDDGVTYAAHLVPIKDNGLARSVKIADLMTNIADDPLPSMLSRYAKALAYLTN